MKTLKLDIQENRAHLLLSRPEVRNAFNEEMIGEMTQCFLDLAHESSLRVVLLKGAGESFCAGGDLRWMKSMVNYSQKENLEDSEKLYQMYEALRAIPCPVMSLVHGHAMGGGLGLLAVSDIVLTEENTQHCFSEVRLGLAPSVIGAFVKDRISPRDMTRYFLTAEVFDGKKAYEMGLAHDYGSLEEMAQRAETLMGKIVRNGPKAVRETKKLMGDLRQGGGQVKKRATELIAQLRVSQEGQEGLAAFLEKRKPNWSIHHGDKKTGHR